MKRILLLSLFFIIPTLAQYTITVDGNPTDWDSNDGGYDGSQLGIHGSGYFNGQWIYRGEALDQRADIGNNADNDITEVRIGADATYLYLLVRMQNIENGGDFTHICLSFDTDQNNSDGALNWNGDDSQTSLGAASQYAERNVTIHDVTSGVGTNLQFELFADDGSSWYAPPTSGAQISVSTTNEVVEGKIALVDLNGISSTSTIRISLATFVNGNNGYNNNVDATQDISSSSDGIDVMTPSASSGTNAWFRDLSDGNVGYSALIDLNQSPLPVELTTFSASVIGSNVKLNWQTATEVNNYGFEIERNTPLNPLSRGEVDGNGVWEKIGFVYGNGNSNSPKSYSFVDDNVFAGSYSYRLKQIDNDGQFEYSKVVEVSFMNPTEFSLAQNYPNPFNPTTTIQFTLPQAGNVKLTLFNLLGQKIKTLINEYKESGVHTLNFNASDLNSGLYIYKLEANGLVKTRKMTLVK
jgi:hypothetical protein